MEVCEGDKVGGGHCSQLSKLLPPEIDLALPQVNPGGAPEGE